MDAETETSSIAKSGDPRDDDPTEASTGDLPYYDSEAPRPPMPMAPPPLYPLSNDHSLPTPEEAVNMAAFRGLPPQQKKKIFLILGSIVGLTLIVGFSTGIAISRQGSSASSSSASEVSPEERLANTKSFLTSFSSRGDINSKGSPQNLAAEWIAVTDQRQVDIPASASYEDSYEFVQRYVLAVLYYATQGDSWEAGSLSHFMRSSSECRCVPSPTTTQLDLFMSWSISLLGPPLHCVFWLCLPVGRSVIYNQLELRLAGAHRSGRGRQDSVAHGRIVQREGPSEPNFPPYVASQRVDENDHPSIVFQYVSLTSPTPPHLGFVLTAHNNMQGQLPSELNHLQSMEHFSVYGNSLTGPLPDLGQWQELNFLNLDSNSLTGSIGSWFNFPKLEYLDLAGNDFTGQLPTFDGATNLLEAALQNNRFEGSVDAFNGATSLSILYLQNNNLNGPLSSETLADVSLRQFDASNNRITGSFPAHFYKFHAVDMHNNSLTGELPPVTTGGGPMYFLSLYGNQIEGSLPDTLGMLYNLIHLDLSSNKFTGKLLNIFDQLQKLEYLFLHNNNFDSGTIIDMWKLTTLKELSLKGTNRVGPIPGWIGKYLTNLVLLDLHQNQLTGTIPTSFGSMTGLRFLFLNDNRLNGTIPSELANMDGLCTWAHGFGRLTTDFPPVSLFFPSALCFSQRCCPFSATTWSGAATAPSTPCATRSRCPRTLSPTARSPK